MSAKVVIGPGTQLFLSQVLIILVVVVVAHTFLNFSAVYEAYIGIFCCLDSDKQEASYLVIIYQIEVLSKFSKLNNKVESF